MEAFCSECKLGKKEGLKGDHNHCCKTCGELLKVRCKECNEIFSRGYSKSKHQNYCSVSSKRLKLDMDKQLTVHIPLDIQFSGFTVNPETPYDIFYKRHLIGGYPCKFTGFEQSIDWKLENLMTLLGEEIPVFMKVCKLGASEFKDVKTTLKEFLKKRETSVDPVYAMDINIHGTKLDKQLKTPFLFKDDWLDATRSNISFRVLYIGGPSTFCGFHVDICGIHTYIQLVQGVKIYYIFPPESKDIVKKLFTHGQHFVVQPNAQMHSAILEAKGMAIKIKKGEGIFIPAGWWHAAINVTDTIAWGDSFINASNIDTVTKIWIENPGEFKGIGIKFPSFILSIANQVESKEDLMLIWMAIQKVENANEIFDLAKEAITKKIYKFFKHN